MMDEWIKTLLSGAGALTGALAAVFLFARHAGKRMLDEHFKRMDTLRSAQVQLAYAAQHAQRKEEGSIYPACSALVRRAKTGAEEARKASNVFQIGNSTLFATCRELTNKLPDYEIYLPRHLFHKLHEYKHALQELVMIWDIATSSVKPDPDTGAPPSVPPPTKIRVEELCDKIAAFCDDITSELRKCMLALGEPLPKPHDD